MFDETVAAAIKAVEEREKGCPVDPQLAQIWRDRRDGRAYLPGDPILAAALDATRALGESGTPQPEPVRAEKPEPVGGGDPYGDRRAMEAADRRAIWLNSGAYMYADTYATGGGGYA